MLLCTQKTIALRCPQCGKMGFYPLSRFSFAGGEGIRVTCECGACLLSLARKGKLYFCLQIECAMCETRHIYKYKTAELWGDRDVIITCEQSAVEIGIIGNRKSVLEKIRSIKNSLQEESADIAGDDKYFIKPDIMREVLDLLQQMADKGKVRCNCGSGRIEREVFPDRVELNCPYCEAVGILFAETVKDLQWVYYMDEICLEAYTFKYLDASRVNKRSFSKKKPVKK